MELLLAVGFALFLWWFSTGVLIYIDGLPKRTFWQSMAGMSAMAVVALFWLGRSAHDSTAMGAYVAFVAAVVLWAWHEMTFLLGWLTGPRKQACPPGARGWARFTYATQVVIHHEVALAVTVGAVVFMTWGAPNQVGTWTLWVLWVMRLSAKLNLFLGVRNLAVEIIPEHLKYMVSYFRRSQLNPLMPFSILVASGIAVWIARLAMAEPTGSPTALGLALVGTLLALAVLEHLFLALPVPDMVLWKWALRSHHRNKPALGS